MSAALAKATCAPFFEEGRMKFAEPSKLDRKSGMWGTQLLWKARVRKSKLDFRFDWRIRLKAFDGASPPSFSAQVRWGEPGAPVLPLRPFFRNPEFFPPDFLTVTSVPQHPSRCL